MAITGEKREESQKKDNTETKRNSKLREREVNERNEKIKIGVGEERERETGRVFRGVLFVEMPSRSRRQKRTKEV